MLRASLKAFLVAGFLGCEDGGVCVTVGKVARVFLYPLRTTVDQELSFLKLPFVELMSKVSGVCTNLSRRAVSGVASVICFFGSFFSNF